MDQERAPAKINLALHVRARRSDGYHDLETLFYFIDIYDYLKVTDSPDISLNISGPLGASPALAGDNLVLRAARLLAHVSGSSRGAALHLEKHIPLAAGLGGGSADAAATLRLLNRFWGLDWPIAKLQTLAAALGADVPACLASRPQMGRGRGEILEALAGHGLEGAPILLVNPHIAMPTGPVFAGWDGQDRGPLLGLADSRNDLEAPAMRLGPVIGTVLDTLRAQAGAGLVRMSGSGATCFALFETEAALEAAARQVAQAHPDWWVRAAHILGG